MLSFDDLELQKNIRDFEACSFAIPLILMVYRKKRQSKMLKHSETNH